MPIYLGTEAFVEALHKSAKLNEVPRLQRLVSRPSLAEMFRNAVDNATIAQACREHGYTMKEFADHLDVHYAAISRRLRRHEQAESAGS